MKKGTIILGIIFIFIVGLTIYVAVDKYGNKKEEVEEERKVNIGTINIKVDDDEKVKKSLATTYNIEVLNNIESFIKEEVEEEKEFNNNDIVKSNDCKGKSIYKKLDNGVYTISIDSTCNDDSGVYFKLKVIGNLNGNGNLYKLEEVDDGYIGASYISNGTKTSSILKFNKDLDLEWSYDISYADFGLEKDKGIDVTNIVKNNDDIYVIGYLNDDAATVFALKLNNGIKVWQKKVSADMIVSNAFIIDNKLVIIDGKEINVIDDEVETIELDVTDNKLNGFKAGKLVYYNNNYYVYNIKGVASFAIFNTSGLADKLYTNDLENDAYLNTLNIYDNKLFFNYENGKIIVVDIFGRYIDTLNYDGKVNLYTNSNNFSVVTTNNKSYKLDKYDYKLKKTSSYDILMVSDKKNILDTNDKVYEYLTNNSYIVFFEFDKN